MTSRPRRRVDPARRLAFGVLRAVSGQGAYANLELARQRDRATLDPRDAAFATELVSGTCRLSGTYDLIIARATARPTANLDPAVLDVLRLGAHQILSMRVPPHAAVAATVDLAALEISERITGLVNAALRRIARTDLDGWLGELEGDLDPLGRVALRNHHPRWIVEALSRVLPPDELVAALEANNQPPTTHLVVRPGLSHPDELASSQPARFSPFGAYLEGNPSDLPAVREGRAGVQDEGSQLVALVLSRIDAPAGPWLDLCAGPGGKAALLAGLAMRRDERLVASEVQPHRGGLVRQALRRYVGPHRPVTLVADGTRPAWREQTFARVMADVPCTGLGALRRRPESRWRRQPSDLASLLPLQSALLESAIRSTSPGGVVAYVTCSPHPEETRGVVDPVVQRGHVEVLRAADHLPEVPDAAVGDFIQLWPHRHGTDAMFLALLRRR